MIDHTPDRLGFGPGTDGGLEAGTHPHVLVRILPQLRRRRSQVGPGGDQPADLCIGVAGEPGEGIGRGMAVPGQRVHLVVREAQLDDRG
ncbi:hypothetical protein ACFY04_19310 [Streptomyces sp. NPDC001549]|uniref:hypothetical protein n=1 Tax=Streptomyces sp. NPDC001549 TaxID=3364586 RepID=UPI0036CFD4A0